MRSFFTIVLALSASMLVSAARPPKELVIEKTYVPKWCLSTSKNGDTLTMRHDGTSALKSEHYQLLTFPEISQRLTTLKPSMCIGEKRKLIIPPDLAYGEKGIRYKIPRMATVVLEVELVAIDKEDGKDGSKKEF
ncbi:Peptidyl-prolyl cis-trans isomerase fkbp13, chloroplastic [Tulasnella sp. 425]|nr:Peptidyl-prolyl cis-trans isomerase fkbp13, chloroplastic [Tulasnella sp. 425]